MQRPSPLRLLLAVALLAVCTSGTWLLSHSRSYQSATGGLKVVASFYPMGEFASQVGGNKVQVTTLVKPGTEPHDYDPSASDMATIYQSKVLIYNGAGLERWADKISGELDAHKVVHIRASDGLSLRPRAQSDAENNASADPHVWMDPVLAIRQVTNIKKGLIAADPANRQTYETNAANYIAQLQALSSSFKTGLQHCRLHQIVTSHQAFSYLAAEYDLQAVGIAGLSPDSEPSPEKLAQVAEFARKNNVGYIFFETLLSPKLSQTIAREVGAKTIAFNPLEGLTANEIAAGKNYVSVQKDNLRALRTALDCN
ncbi:MAG TPA: zinc ABC transporter substrate-binding protein [Bacillota bacterium]|nr:zinc ABC transporter substrate-binding protein [Bacillota bacterium]